MPSPPPLLAVDAAPVDDAFVDVAAALVVDRRREVVDAPTSVAECRSDDDEPESGCW